jgi:hypothetical protein
MKKSRNGRKQIKKCEDLEPNNNYQMDYVVCGCYFVTPSPNKKFE